MAVASFHAFGTVNRDNDLASELDIKLLRQDWLKQQEEQGHQNASAKCQQCQARPSRHELSLKFQQPETQNHGQRDDDAAVGNPARRFQSR